VLLCGHNRFGGRFSAISLMAVREYAYTNAHSPNMAIPTQKQIAERERGCVLPQATCASILALALLLLLYQP
jgi:hypothetical protein